jgi:tellurite methyltransferase
MGESERETWNRRYAERSDQELEGPSELLVELIGRVESGTAGRRALDVACGEGRNAIFLARRGFQVLGVDNSDVALQKARELSANAGVDIDYCLLDLREELPEGPFDLIIVFNFLLRPLLPKLYGLLGEGGYLMMEAILQGSGEGAVRHNPEFAVVEGELEQLFSTFDGQVVVSTELPDRDRVRMLFRKG